MNRENFCETNGEINRENIQKWINALRSGEFQWGRSQLRRGDGYCCLGVACEIYRREHPETSWVDDFFDAVGESRETCLPTKVSEWLGVIGPDVTLYLDDGRRTTATYCNDDLKLSFDEIANAIESTYLRRSDRLSR